MEIAVVCGGHNGGNQSKSMRYILDCPRQILLKQERHFALYGQRGSESSRAQMSIKRLRRAQGFVAD